MRSHHRVQDAAISNVTQQSLAQGLKQVATAMTTGVNFGNFAKASNIASQVSNARTEVQNKIRQVCGASGFAQNVVSQYCNNVSVSGTGGDVGCKISDVVQNNVAKVANNCSQKAVVHNKAIQNLQQTMDQLAVAKAVGLDLTQLLIVFIIAAAVVLSVIFLSTSSIAKAAVGEGGKYIVLAAGVIMGLIGLIMFLIAKRDNQGNAFIDHHSGLRKDGSQTYATMNMKWKDGWGHEDGPPVINDIQK